MWYVCYAEPRKVLRLAEALSERGERVECPSFRFRRRVPRRNKSHEVERPLIGGVFFCHESEWPLGPGIVAGVDLALVRRLNWMGSPARIKDVDLHALRSASIARTRSKTLFCAGDLVVVDFGPFAGARAVVEGVNESQLVLSVEGMNLPLTVAPFIVRKR